MLNVEKDECQIVMICIYWATYVQQKKTTMRSDLKNCANLKKFL